MSTLPEFNSDEEAAAWFDTHDTAEFIATAPELETPLQLRRTAWTTTPLDVRLRTDYLEAIQAVAERQGVPYQRLVQNWLMERVSQEAPDLVLAGQS